MTKLSYSVFLFILAFSPLAFATVEHWSLMTVELLSSVAFLLMLAGLKRKHVQLLSAPGLAPLLLLLALMLVQLVPLPAAVIRQIAQGNWDAYRLVYEQGGGVGWLPLSVNQKATLQEFLRIASYTVFYVLTIQLHRRGKRVKKTLKCVVVLAIVIAFIAILQQFTADGRIYWIRPAPGGEPGGPWVNINQYAAFIAAMSPLALGLFLFYRPLIDDKAGWRERIVACFSSPNSGLYLMFGSGFILMILSVFISLCRGGIVTIVLSMLLYILLVSYKRRSFRNVTLWASLCIALLSVTWFGWQPIVDKFGDTFAKEGVIWDGRMTVWSDCLTIIKDFPLFGTGFGTFNDIYPSFKTITLDIVFDHAHNDYLELLTDGGLIAFILAAWFCLSVLHHGWKKIRQRGDRLAVLGGISCFISILALLIHSLFDFNLHNGAVGLYFFFLCGLLVATVNTKYQTHRARTSLTVVPERTAFLLGAATSLVLIATLAVQVGISVAGYQFAKIETLYVTSQISPSIAAAVERDVKSAQVYDPLDGLYPYYLGNLSAVRGNREEALARYLLASRKQPMEGIYLQRIGMILPAGSTEARAFMWEGYRRLRKTNEVAYGWAKRLLLSEERELAAGVLTERIGQTYPGAAMFAAILDAHDFSHEEMKAIIPHEVRHWVIVGEHLERRGNRAGARYCFDQASRFAENEPEVVPELFSRMIRFYQRHDWHPEALRLIRLAIKKQPDVALFHLWLGDHYYDKGITFRAREEYTRAAMIEPTNETYRKRLLRLEP